MSDTELSIIVASPAKGSPARGDCDDVTWPACDAEYVAAAECEHGLGGANLVARIPAAELAVLIGAASVYLASVRHQNRVIRASAERDNVVLRRGKCHSWSQLLRRLRLQKLVRLVADGNCKVSADSTAPR